MAGDWAGVREITAPTRDPRVGEAIITATTSDETPLGRPDTFFMLMLGGPEPIACVQNYHDTSVFPETPAEQNLDDREDRVQMKVSSKQNRAIFKTNPGQPLPGTAVRRGD